MNNGAYARPDTIVSTDWVSEHLDDPKIRLSLIHI